MLKRKSGETGENKPPRLLPGVIIVVLQWLAVFVVPAFVPDATVYGLMAGVFGGGVSIIVWWLFFSRLPRVERWGALVLVIAALIATPFILHDSIATGAMGLLFYIYVVPGLSLALAAWAVLSRKLPEGLRRPALAAAILLACGFWALLRTGGFTSDLDHDFAWRWSETPEERLLTQAGDVAAVPPAAVPIADSPAEWPGFRGPHRDGRVRGVSIKTDWAGSPPLELWRQPVGPGWSSIAVHADRVYTQEQRGEDEVVACYRLSTGEPLWIHGDAARFWESNGGAGPRGTPTLSEGRVYTFGATGILNALDGADGTVIWSRNAATDTETKIPGWGFSSSPLVVGDLVIVAVKGDLAAYDLLSGEPRWFGPKGGYGYSSPHLLTLDGVAQVLLMRSSELISVSPADGKLLWEHTLPSGTSIVQPALTAKGDLLISDGDTNGMRRLAVTQRPGGWTIEERWTTIRLKPYFSDFVIHKGHAYGFDGSILACIDVEDGRRNWKGGRYGQGQFILLADEDLLLVVSEQGELALVKAVPGQFTELARFPAMDGKTWNHPVLVGNVLLVRNGEEMVAFKV